LPPDGVPEMVWLMIYLNSSAILAADYVPWSMVMTIQFTSGGAYDFHGVPPSIFQGLINASSPGTYYNQHIRGRYH
jgi:hypothetical protein